MTPDDLSRLRAYDDLTARIWRDKRCTPGAREMLLAMAWITARDADYNSAAMPDAERGRHLWRLLRDMLGADRYGRPRYKQLVADDAPCYQAPNTWPQRVCEAPRVRAYRPRTLDAPMASAACLLRHPHLGACRYTAVPGVAAVAVKSAPAEPSAVCGAPPKLDFHLVERDPLTGWHVDHYFCARHRDHYERVRAQLADAPEAPEPIPNVGGLLPCYFRADWERVYTQVRPHWKPPVYGIAADDWPGAVSGGVTPRRPRLRLILGELADVGA